MDDKQLDHVVELIYSLLDEFDVEDLRYISHIELADFWVKMINAGITDETALKACLKSYLRV